MPPLALRLLKAHNHAKTRLRIPQARRCIDFGDVAHVRRSSTILPTHPPVTRNSSRALVDHLRPVWRPWKERLQTFDQYEYESSLDKPPLRGVRLVDQRKFKDNAELWLELVCFRERIDGLRGIGVIWRAYVQRAVPPRESRASQAVWKSFLRLGFRDHQVLGQMCEYKVPIGGRYRGTMRGLYYDIMKHVIETKPSELHQWHSRLKNETPNAWQYRELLKLAIFEGSAFREFLDVHKDSPLVEEYSHIIPNLCAHHFYDDAVLWHRILIQKGDFPPTPSAVQPLLRHLTTMGKHELHDVLLKEMSDAGLSFEVDTTHPSKMQPVDLQHFMNELQINLNNVKPKAVSDKFCARLFATRLFSVQTVVSGLHMLSVEAIGPLALREIAARAIEHESIQVGTIVQYLRLLSSAGISLGSSKFSRLVVKAAEGDNAQLLYDIVTSDQHPDVYEDWKLQESLLASYRSIGDQRQINRTLAILTLDETKRSLDTTQWNLLLRSYLTVRDIPNTLVTLENMRGRNVTLTKASRTYLWNQTVSTRRPGQAPSTTKDLPLIIRTWQGFIRTGTHIPAGDWVEILRRLGMYGQLMDFERLATWLARWYVDERSRDSELNTMEGEQDFNRPFKVTPDQKNPTHPYRLLFPHSMQRAVLAWGFQRYGAPNLDGTTSSVRIQTLERSPCLWGLRLLVKLRDSGVHFDRDVIARACKLCLIAMFGPDTSNRLSNQRLRRANNGRWLDYVHAMNRIWGTDLFTSQPGKPPSRRFSVEELN